MSALRVRASAANKWWRGKHRLGQLSLLLARFQGFEIAFHRFHYKPLVAGTTHREFQSGVSEKVTP